MPSRAGSTALYLALRTFLTAGSRLPLTLTRGLGTGLGTAAMRIMAGSRRRILRHLEIAFPELDRAGQERIMAGCARHFGLMLAEVAWLQRCWENGATIAAVCSGALLLAESGLLRGQEATTHWAYGDTLRRDYPGIRVRDQAALVVSGEGGRLVMAGGGTSWLDLALYLIARTCGIEEAMHVARVHLVDWHEVGQQPFARLARSRQSDDAVIARCQVWIAGHYDQPSPVTSMIRLSGLAERTFKRRFREATGMSPLEYVHTLRLEEAKQLLESTDQAIEAVAAEVGYEEGGFFSRLFRRKVGLTPAQYRKRFGSLRRRLSARAASGPE